MRKSKKVIITCAPTGSIHTPSMSPYLPVTPDEIAAASIEAAEAGAAILHLHARNPEDGRPSPAAKDFMAFLPRIKQASDAVINISTGGSANMSLDDRLEGAHAAQPEICSLNMGPLIFDFSAAGARVAAQRALPDDAEGLRAARDGRGGRLRPAGVHRRDRRRRDRLHGVPHGDAARSRRRGPGGAAAGVHAPG